MDLLGHVLPPGKNLLDGRYACFGFIVDLRTYLYTLIGSRRLVITIIEYMKYKWMNLFCTSLPQAKTCSTAVTPASAIP